MEMPETAGELFGLIRSRYGTAELRDLARLSGVPRMTLQNWQGRPAAPLRQQGREHYRRIFGVAAEEGETRPAPTLADVLAAIHELRGRFDSLLALGKEGRLDATIQAKHGHAKTKHGGGAA